MVLELGRAFQSMTHQYDYKWIYISFCLSIVSMNCKKKTAVCSGKQFAEECFVSHSHHLIPHIFVGSEHCASYAKSRRKRPIVCWSWQTEIGVAKPLRITVHSDAACLWRTVQTELNKLPYRTHLRFSFSITCNGLYTTHLHKSNHNH